MSTLEMAMTFTLLRLRSAHMNSCLVQMQCGRVVYSRLYAEELLHAHHTVTLMISTRIHLIRFHKAAQQIKI